MAARWGVALVAVLLGACAQQDQELQYLKNWEFSTTRESFVTKVLEHMQKSAFCISLDIRGGRHVLAGLHQDGTPDSRMAVLVAAGLLSRVETTPALKVLQHDRDGVWYEITPGDKGYQQNAGGWCFGKRAEVTVVDLGTVARNRRGEIMRTITYSYRAEAMPDYSQSDAFRKAFPEAAVNGAVLRGTMRFMVHWKGVWALPGQPIEV